MKNYEEDLENGEEGRRLVMDEFGWDKIILGIENVYTEVVL